VLEDKALVERTLSSAYHRASFLAASTQHSGDWLFALPIASCGLTLDDEAVRVAVGLRLGLDLCEPHQCQCGHVVDARGLSFVCKRTPGSGQQGTMLSTTWSLDLLPQLECPSQEPTYGLSRADGKRPDGLTLVPWQSGKSLCWDVTVICPLAESSVSGTAREAGATAEVTATRKEEKYAELDSRYLF